MFQAEADPQSGSLDSDPSSSPFLREREALAPIIDPSEVLDPAALARLQRIIDAHDRRVPVVLSDELFGYNFYPVPFTDIDTMLRLHALSNPDGRVMVNNGHLNQLLAGHMLRIDPSRPGEGDHIFTTYQSEMNAEGLIVFAQQPTVTAYVPVDELLTCGRELDRLGYRVSKEPNGKIGALLGPEEQSEHAIPVTRSLLLCFAKQLRQDSVAQDVQVLSMHDDLVKPVSKEPSDQYKHQLVRGHQRHHFGISIAHKLRQSATLYEAMDTLMRRDPALARKIGVVDEIRGLAATNLQFGDDENLAHIMGLLDPELAQAAHYFCRGYTSAV